MFKKEKEIEFTREFTSPVFGNVYVTKRVTLPLEQAQKFIRAGLAVSVVDGVAQMDEQAPANGTVVVSGKTEPAKDPYAGMTAKQKKAAMKAAEEKEKVDAEIAEKQARLDELAALERDLTDEEKDEAESLDADLKALKGE